MSTNVDTVLWEDFSIANDPSGWRIGEWSKTNVTSSSFSVSGGKGVVTSSSSTAGGTGDPLKSVIKWKDPSIRYFDMTFTGDSLDSGNTSVSTDIRPCIVFHWNGTLGAGATGYFVTPATSGKFNLYKLNSADGSATLLKQGSLIQTTGVVSVRVRVAPGLGGNLIQFKGWTGSTEPADAWFAYTDSSFTGGSIGIGVSRVNGDSANTKITINSTRITRLSSTDDTPTVVVPTNGSGADTTNQATYTTSSMTVAGTSKLYVLFVGISHGTNVPTITPSGLGLSWTEIGTAGGAVFSSSQRRLQMFYARGAATSGAMTFATGNANTSGCAWTLCEITNADSGSGVFTHSVAATGISAAAASYTPTGAAAIDSTPHVLTLTGILCGPTANTVAPTGLQVEVAEVNYATPTVTLQTTRGQTITTSDGSWGVTWTTNSTFGYCYVAIRTDIYQAQARTAGGISFSMG